MKFIRRSRRHAQFCLQLIFEKDFLIIIVIGIKLQGSQTGEVAFTSFVPVVRKVVLADLQRTVTSGNPPVGAIDLHTCLPHIVAHFFRLEKMDDSCLRRNLRFHVTAEDVTAHDPVFSSDNQFRMIEIKIHQCFIDRLIGTCRPCVCQSIIWKKFRCQPGQLIRQRIKSHRFPVHFRILRHRSIIIGQWSKQTKIIGIGRNVTRRYRRVIQIVQLADILII